MRSASLVLFAVLGLVSFAGAESDAGKSGDSKGKDADAEKAEAAASEQDEMFAEIPIGETFEGVRIPQMDPNGNLVMLFDTKKAKRIDDRHIDMEQLKIEIHNDDGTTFHVSMPHSVFDLDTNILDSDTPVEIRRDDFVINGDTAQFHTKTKFGRINGNVKMVIFNTGTNE
ncbi:MAG: hypothetical protein WA771_11560 [Chthoniobacterales bacterium]